MSTGNDLAKSPGFVNCSYIPPGFLYAAFSQIRKQWCRARILKVLDCATLIIHLIDYGDEEQLLCSDIRKLDDNLSHFKGYAIECILGDVKPTNNIWSPEALKMCEEQLLYDTVSCFTVSQHLEVPVVRIAKKGEKEPFVQKTH
ncbi:tudor domain-containing protein 15 [Caerostris extrusa]|uniref:Tudor domain-containing protein 15 n=1 Tax=Caerostris extrusa TaxID=172846 RepID=A0AAV4WTR8_CAEEX|nr:tudor domain-containing protein 15 [Caerostris extrusa]